MEEKRLDDAELPAPKRKKLGFFLLISFILIAGASVGTFAAVKKKFEKPYQKFVPKSAILDSALSPKNLANLLNNAAASLIFPQIISKIKAETASLNINAVEMLSKIEEDIILATIKNENSLSYAIITQLPKNFEITDIEAKIRQNFNVSYETYRGEKIITVESLELSRHDERFSYSIIENILLASRDISTLKLSIDESK